MNSDLFSPNEERILKILGRKKMSIKQIAAKFLEGREVFLSDQNGVAGTVRRINEKCEKHELPWFLNGMGSGRGGRVVWKDKR